MKFNLDDETTLADLLALNLHKYEEEVKTIVDKSVKEAAMEKTLKYVLLVKISLITHHGIFLYSIFPKVDWRQFYGVSAVMYLCN